jgi:hypothetical protein
MISVRLFVLNIWLRPPRVERLVYLDGEFALPDIAARVFGHNRGRPSLALRTSTSSDAVPMI